MGIDIVGRAGCDGVGRVLYAVFNELVAKDAVGVDKAGAWDCFGGVCAAFAGLAAQSEEGNICGKNVQDRRALLYGALDYNLRVAGADMRGRGMDACRQVFNTLDSNVSCGTERVAFGGGERHCDVAVDGVGVLFGSKVLGTTRCESQVGTSFAFGRESFDDSVDGADRDGVARGVRRGSVSADKTSNSSGLIGVGATVLGSSCGTEDSGFRTDSGQGVQHLGVDESVTTGKYVPPAKRGPKGGLSVGRGPNYEKNQLARQRKRETGRFPRGGGQVVRMPTFEACDQSVRDELQRTRADRLVLENKLRAVKLRQELEVAESRDVQQMIQQQRTQLLRQTELNRVQIEKAHGSLSGEVAGSVPIVPTVVGGTVETVLTGGSISPSSSISEAEIRKLHKDFLDGQARIAKLEKDNYKLRFGVHQEDSEGGPDDGALWDGGEDSVSQDQFSYRSGYMCTPEQREENKKLALELRGW